MPTLTCQVSLLKFALDKPVGGSGVASVDVVVVDLTDAEGRAGMGFTYTLGIGGTAIFAAARELIEQFVIGKPLAPPQAMWRRLSKGMNRIGRGAHGAALAAVDVALWDLHAKSLGVPLAVALGGEPRAVPVYGSGGFKPDGDVGAALKTAEDYLARGVKALKPRLSGGPGDAAVLKALRDRYPDVALMADLNEKGDALSAARTMAICADHGVLWLEEPLPAADLSGFARLASRGGVPIAAGEHLQGLEQFTHLIAAGQIAVAQPDLAMIGGVTPSLLLAGVAEAHGVVVAPHFLPNLFVHLAAAAPNLTWLEDFPLLEPLFGDPPCFDAKGNLAPGAAPGHGLVLAEGAQERFGQASWASA